MTQESAAKYVKNTGSILVTKKQYKLRNGLRLPFVSCLAIKHNDVICFSFLLSKDYVSFVSQKKLTFHI